MTRMEGLVIRLLFGYFILELCRMMSSRVSEIGLFAFGETKVRCMCADFRDIR